MKLNVYKEVAFMDLNDKTIASLQPNVSPGRYNLKLQANESNFENCSANSISKPISQSVLIFFTFVHPYVVLYLLC